MQHHTLVYGRATPTIIIVYLCSLHPADAGLKCRHILPCTDRLHAFPPAPRWSPRRLIHVLSNCIALKTDQLEVDKPTDTRVHTKAVQVVQVWERKWKWYTKQITVWSTLANDGLHKWSPQIVVKNRSGERLAVVQLHASSLRFVHCSRPVIGPTRVRQSQWFFFGSGGSDSGSSTVVCMLPEIF